MKKLILTFALGLFITSCSQVKEVSPKETTDDIQRIYQGEIDHIVVSNAIDAEIIKSNTEKIVLKGDDQDLKYVKVELNHGKLMVGMKKRRNISFKTKAIKAKIYVKDFISVEANSSAEIEFKNQFTQDKIAVKSSSSGSVKGDLEANHFNIEVSSSGDFEGKIWAVRLDAQASSSGDIEVEGKAKKVNVKVSSSGDFDGKDLRAKMANLEASSSGDISLHVEEVVNAKASSAGEIAVYHHGDLRKKHFKQSSGGEIALKKSEN